MLISFFSITYYSAQVGTTCENPIVINSLPYTTTDDTANYADNYDPDPSTNITCGWHTWGNYFHSGNDVIYSYTPSTTGTITIEIPSSAAKAYTGMFVYTSCSNIGINYAACTTALEDGDALTINDFSVTAGQTYYILISSWSGPSPFPQTVSYTLNVTTQTLGTNELMLSQKKTYIYPNPTEKELHFNPSKKIHSATIYTIDGKKIKTFKVNNNLISVEGLTAGSYIVEFTDISNNVSTKIFIKK
ncbi:T9SS type A sorting domain-containing protein [Chryseobacterium sp.]|uniref:T9SS type A sorting domain-containing protein n=1 Tax=Chryseobacterium sp. TaxID=1871047 RepID=UPI001B09418C|nr:T9SS type A sorting domain-containing protein [Chryseobacterium sp.]MBO9692937.1 T9SS type A sorting domain-containing protein [Chryseobacterium sp.]